MNALPLSRTKSVIAWLMDSSILLLMLLGLPFMPMFAAVMERNARHLRAYRASLRQCMRHTHAMRRAQVVSRNAFRTHDDVQRHHVHGQCTHCGRCCLHNSCVFLKMENGQSRCGIYGSRFFRLLSCGEYPMTAEDISVYACPSFVAQPVSQEIFHAAQSGKRRYIRIVQER